MGVWDTLIGLAATALKEHPRKEVLRNVLELRNAMIACQKTFDDYQAVLKEGDYDSVMEKRRALPMPVGVITMLYDPLESWRETVAKLAQTLTLVNTTLTIFGPETGLHVLRYKGIEESLNVDAPMDVLNSLDAGVDLGKVSLSSRFNRAIKELDEFIRTKFEVEEVFATQKHIRPWPAPFRFYGEYWLTVDWVMGPT